MIKACKLPSRKILQWLLFPNDIIARDPSILMAQDEKTAGDQLPSRWLFAHSDDPFSDFKAGYPAV